MPRPYVSDTLKQVNPVPRRALIVDDSRAFCAAATAMLESAGVEVVGTAATLATAVHAADETRPDLILVDIDLGGENGFDVVAALNDLALEPRPAIVLVSTHDEDDFADLVESSAAVGFVPKFALSVELIARAITR